MTFSDDLRQFLTALLLVIGGLLPIVNPVASAPVFLTMTRGSDAATRAKLAVEIAASTFMLLMGSLVFGAFVLKLFGLSIPVVQVAGGAVLIALAWNLLHDDGQADETPDTKPNPKIIMRAFYPLTLPVTVDPGAISVAITLGANHAHGLERVAISFVAALIGVSLISVAVWLVYRYAQHVQHWIGHTRMMVVLRLSAFILLCIGVQISWNGVRNLARELPFAMTTSPATSPSETPAVETK